MESWRLYVSGAVGLVLAIALLWGLAGLLGIASVYRKLPRGSGGNRVYGIGYIFVALGAAGIVYGNLIVENDDRVQLASVFAGGAGLVLGVILMLITESRAKRKRKRL
jgi:predicted membrane channel-forming protein YqfA (hemolysin III family)